MKKKENSSEKERYPIVAKLNKVLKCLQKTKQLYDYSWVQISIFYIGGSVEKPPWCNG